MLHTKSNNIYICIICIFIYIYYYNIIYGIILNQANRANGIGHWHWPMQPQSSTETIKQFRMGLGCSSELSGFRRDPHLDSKGLHSLVDASSNGCWRSRYTTRYTVCNYVMCDIYIYTYVDVSLSYLLFSYPIYSYLSLSMYIHMQPQHHHQQLQLSTIVPLENPSPS